MIFIQYMYSTCDMHVSFTHTNMNISPLLYTYTHHQAIELDPENESYRANLKTVEEQLQGGGAASTAAGGEMGGATSGGGGGASQQQQPGGGGGNPLGGELCQSLSLFLTSTSSFKN